MFWTKGYITMLIISSKEKGSYHGQQLLSSSILPLRSGRQSSKSRKGSGTSCLTVSPNPEDHFSKGIASATDDHQHTTREVENLMAARNRMSSRGPTLPAHEESQMWNDALSSLKQLPEVHGKATKVAAEANKTQRLLPNLGNGEGRHFKVVLTFQKRAQIYWEEWKMFTKKE